MYLVIEQGEVYDPAPRGRASVLVVGEKIGRVGEVDGREVERMGMPVRVLAAGGCFVVPGFIDPHAHLIGAGGEAGPGSRMPEVGFEEIVRGGVTTVVGCLGTDSVSRTLRGLLGKVRELEARGMTAYLYTGAFQVPPPTLTGSVIDDLVLIDKVIGIGEIAIADVRSSQPTAQELARLAATGYQASLITGKAGVLHLHVGPGEKGLSVLREVLEQYEVSADHVYPTHVTRTKKLVKEAAELAKRGAYVDTDTVEAGLGEALRYFWECGGPRERFTVSSDTHTEGGTFEKYYEAFAGCVREGMAMEEVLSCFTRNTARALKLAGKGELRAGADADVLVIERGTLALRHVVARGRAVLVEGKLVA